MTQPDPEFWRDRRVLLTGHTGFKGAWLALWLRQLGAQVTGFALPPQTEPSLWRTIGDGLLANELIGDLRDPEAIASAVELARPSVVIHMAAQALVRTSFESPVATYATNLMGTVHLLEALRGQSSLQAALIVTTDKVYANDESGSAFTEADRLGGHDPYSASKACAELATASYAMSFFADHKASIATARAGNVIGGGDWSQDRLIPDVWRAAKRGEAVKLRNPSSSRPWQHVLEPLSGYLLYCERLALGGHIVPPALNFGPRPDESATVGTVAAVMGKALGQDTGYEFDDGVHVPEMKFLSIDPSLAAQALGWHPRLTSEEAIEWSADWYTRMDSGEDARQLCLDQIGRYQARDADT